LTAARRNEVAGMTWREVDESGVWTLPMARSKTKSGVVRPLSAMTLRIINEQPLEAGQLLEGAPAFLVVPQAAANSAQCRA